MKLLALDTSSDACSCALQIDQETLSFEEIAPRRHADLILEMIDRLFVESGVSPSQLDAVAFGCGPGSFTGIRIAVGVTQGIAFGLQLPVIPISTLAILAQGAFHQNSQCNHVLVAIDARMSEVYWGEYQLNQNLMQLVGEEIVCKPDSLPLYKNEQYHGVGCGWKTYHDILKNRFKKGLFEIIDTPYPFAKNMLPLANNVFENKQYVSVENALPVYLRNQVTFN
jgi:tRNA threonylcarbamoyladenosine biosynthesis protein TsaB